MNRPSERPHALELEQWLLSEQSADQRTSTEARLDQAEQRALRADDQALRARLLAAHPPAVLAARVRARVPAPRGRLYAVGLVAACALFLLLRVPGTPEPSERVKGQTMELRVYRQRGAAVERLAEGAEVAPHELLQLGYLREGHAHGVLLSIDGRGGVTLHYPRSRTDSSALPSGSGEQLLGHAYELDDAPGFERFIFVGADTPLSIDEVLAAARAVGEDPARARSETLQLKTPNQQRALLLHKALPR